MTRGLALAAILSSMLVSSLANASTTAAAASVLVVPVVAATSSYESEIFVRFPDSTGTGTPITVNVKFYEAANSPTPGLRTCDAVILNVQQTVAFTLSTQCSLDANAHFGMLILESADAVKTRTFFAYSRTQTPSGNGFSVEAYPIGNFSGAVANADGLKRQAASPVYQSNCFVGALGEPVDYQIRLFDSNNTQVGSDVTGSLQPYQMIRYLDIFDAAGLPPGDISVIRARFDNTNAGEPAFVALCTVQESTFFGADVRIAKSDDANDNAKRRRICYGESVCGTAITGPGSVSVANSALKNIHSTIITAPDYVECVLVSTQVDKLEMQVRGPGDVFGAPLFVLPAGYTAPPYSVGGDNQTSFYIFTGEKNAFNGGLSARLFIDVSYREGSGTATFPIEYGITCYSGNGLTVPTLRPNSQAPDNF